MAILNAGRITVVAFHIFQAIRLLDLNHQK